MARKKDFDVNEVLDKAMTIFWDKGYHGTSMQDLVDGLGISRSSMYGTFSDKHSLFMKALEKYQKFSSTAIADVIDELDPAMESIRKLMEFVTYKLLTDDRHKGCFLVNSEIELAAHHKDVHALVILNDQQTEDLFFSLIKKGQQNGEIERNDDARATARFILNAVKGIRVTAKSVFDKIVFDDIIKLTLRVVGR